MISDFFFWAKWSSLIAIGLLFKLANKSLFKYGNLILPMNKDYIEQTKHSKKTIKDFQILEQKPSFFYLILTEENLKEHIYTTISSFLLNSPLLKWQGKLECEDFDQSRI